MLGSIDDAIYINEDDKREVVNDLDGWFRSVLGFTVFHLNIRSLNKHWDELKVVLRNQIVFFMF